MKAKTYLLLETSDGALNKPDLIVSIENSAFSNYVNSISSDESQFTIYCANELIQADIDILDALVAAHEGNIEEIFVASGGGIDISNVPFRKPNIFGLFEKGALDEKGDVVLLEMYKDYDEGTGLYDKLAVKETRTYQRNVVGGMEKRITNIQWYYENGKKANNEKDTQKFFSAAESMTQNQKSRTNLVNKAGTDLVMDLIKQYGPTEGEDKAQEFLASLTDVGAIYMQAINIEPLVTAVENTAFAYMLEDSLQQPGTTRKDMFKTTINISYP